MVSQLLRSFFAVAVMAFILITSACRYNLNNLDIPSWDIELLGPITKTTLGLENLTELQDLIFSENIGIGELGLPPGVIPVPSISAPMIGPVNKRIFDQFELLEADSIFMEVTMLNEFPFTIKQGTSLVFANKNSGSVIFDFPLEDDLDPGESVTKEVIILNKEVEPVLAISATNFSTGSTQGVTLESDDRVVLTFKMVFIRLADAYILPNQSLQFSDTVNFDLQGNGLNASAVEGVLNLFVNNPYPLEGEVQAYFFDQSGILLDSLFNPRGTIDLPVLSNNSVEQAKESQFSAAVNQSRVNQLLMAKKVWIYFKLGTPDGSSAYHAENINFFEGILTGDLKVQITN